MFYARESISLRVGRQAPRRCAFAREETMQVPRRRLFLMSCAALSGMVLRVQRGRGQDPVGGKRHPDGSDDASNNPTTFPPGSSKAMLEERQKNIKKAVEKLYNLAEQLKTEVEKTDSTTVLSLGMVKKAEEIEKLAKQIKDRAKG
jgi:hypothetical protein